jgi:hypothetical protein
MSRYNYSKKSFDFGDFEITKREILASIFIIAVMLLIGVLISDKISEHQMDADEVYNKAVKIESTDLFQYGMDTNVGNAFIYGDLEAVDTIAYPEIDREYMYIEKIKEKYTKHTRTVTYKDNKSKERTKKETYWTWDKVGSEDKKCQEITFCGVLFSIDKIDIPSAGYIDTIKESSRIRYKYYGVSAKYTGTIFADLRNGTIPDNTHFYNNKDIEKTMKQLETGGGVILFWILWIVLICGCVFAFYYLDNKWLE